MEKSEIPKRGEMFERERERRGIMMIMTGWKKYMITLCTPLKVLFEWETREERERERGVKKEIERMNEWKGSASSHLHPHLSLSSHLISLFSSLSVSDRIHWKEEEERINSFRFPLKSFCVCIRRSTRQTDTRFHLSPFHAFFLSLNLVPAFDEKEEEEERNIHPASLYPVPFCPALWYIQNMRRKGTI